MCLQYIFRFSLWRMWAHAYSRTRFPQNWSFLDTRLGFLYKPGIGFVSIVGQNLLMAADLCLTCGEIIRHEQLERTASFTKSDRHLCQRARESLEIIVFPRVNNKTLSTWSDMEPIHTGMLRKTYCGTVKDWADRYSDFYVSVLFETRGLLLRAKQVLHFVVLTCNH